MLSYRKILKRSFNISWENKYLWFFGLFASLLGVSGRYWFNMEEHKERMLHNGEVGIFSGSSLGNILEALFSNPFAIIILAIFIALSIFILWLSISSQGAIIDHVAKIDKSKKKIDLRIKDGINTGSSKFWPIFWLNIIANILLAIVFCIITSPILLTISIGLSAVLYAILFIIFIPVAVSVILMFKYALNYIMIKDQCVGKAINSSWKLFSDNWMVSLEMVIILFIINFLAGLAILISLAIISIPLLIIAISFLKIFSFVIFYTLIAISVIILIVIGIILSSFLYTFTLSSWTILFLSLEKGKGSSKLERIAEKKSKKKTITKKKKIKK